jgi:Ca-activated chloride channel homolog
MLSFLLAAALAQTPAVIGLRVEAQPLGRGTSGTVVGLVLQVAPEDRAAVGERVSVEISFSVGGAVVDHGTAVVMLAGDGTAMLYREWPVGEGKATVAVASLDGKRGGIWSGQVKVTEQQEAFEAPADAAPDALALAVTPPAAEGVAFLPPPRTGGLGALQLELKAPDRTAKVEFFQDDEPLVQKQRPPWTVSISLGQSPRRTTIRGVAWAADGGFVGEDAVVLNGPGNQLPVDILLGPEPSGGVGERTITVSARASAKIDEIVLKLDDKPLARWLECPCVTRVSVAALAQGKVLVAEANGAGGLHGDSVKVLGGSHFVEEVRVDQVELPVVVIDKSGRPIADVPRDAFKVYEDGEEASIDSFGTTAELPLSLGILVDTSGSMERTFDDVRRAVAGFARDLLRPGDSYFLSTFAFEARIEQPWAEDPKMLSVVLDRITPIGGTALHDAVVSSLEQFRGRRSRTALVLLSDGDDTTSRTNWDVALRFCRTARTPIFPIGLRIASLDLYVRSHLKALAESTGGEAFFVSKATDLPDVYHRISEQLRAQYLLSYRSSSTKGKDDFRSVKVVVAREGATARTIAGYFPGW